MAKNFETPDFSRVAKETMRHIVHIAAVEGLRFFQDRFKEQGWKNVALEPWKPKKHKDGYKILLKTRYLENSIQVFSKSNKRIVFGSDAEYARIHNEGGTIRVTNSAKAKRFFWYMWRKTRQPHWKAMAMSKKPFFIIHIPKRQFIGESRWLLNHLENEFKTLIENQIKILKS